MKNLSLVKVVLVSAVMACGLIGTGQEQDKASTQDQELKKIKEMGIGIYKIKYDSKGAIESFLVVGQAEISTVLGPVKAQLMARKAAEQSAKAALVQFMKETVTVVETSDNQTVLTTEGNGGSLLQKGKSVDKQSAKFKSVSSEVLSGLTLIHYDLDADKKSMTAIYGWKPKFSEIGRELREKMNNDKTAGSGEDGLAAAPVSQDQAGLKSKKVTSDIANDFL
ncbi:MAG: hypothetical protein WCV67_00780 [Victivallaceae bacterium]|jgi:hypothetical protein